jgi:Na(+)-translocating NADH:ubiquinone oxidoreductase F subunit
VKDDCPVAYNGIIEAFKEIIPTLLKQIKDLSYYAERKIPDRKSHDISGDQNIYVGAADSLIKGKIVVCRVDDLPKGEVLRFDFQKKTYAIYRTVNNEFYATDGLCTHGNAHLAEGAVMGDIIECHKHNGRFNLRDGTPRRTPVIVAIKTYKVEVILDNVVLNLAVFPGDQSAIAENEQTLRVVSNRNLTTFIKELILSPPGNEHFAFLPGQYVQIIVPPFSLDFSEFQIEEPFRRTWEESGLFHFKAENEIYSKRNYSLASNPSEDTYLKFNVRISLPPAGSPVTAGAGSSYIFNKKPGDEIKFIGPFGDFLLKRSEREMIYLGGGAGMAPLRSHLSYLFETEKTARKVSYWYGARSYEDLFYQEYFRKLEQNNPNFSFHVALSEPKLQDNWNGNIGFIHDYLLEKYLGSHSQPGEIEYYLCGPPGMIRAALKMLKNLRVPDELIAFDEF